MKTLSSFFLAAILICLLPNTAQSQNFSFGGGVGYGSLAEQANLQVNAYFKLPGTPIRLGGDLSFYLPDKEEFDGGDVTTTVIETNLNVHYLVVDTRAAGVYALTGLNVNFLTSSANLADIKASETDTTLGWNVGAGAEVNVGFGRAFGEAKYVISENSQLVLGAGMRVTL